MDFIHATTLLFTPGDAPLRFDKALQSGTDGVVLDLEDGVAPEHKRAARQNVFAWLASQPTRRIGEAALAGVRLNAPHTADMAEDLDALKQSLQQGAGPAFVVIPKVESALDLRRIVECCSAVPSLQPGIVALIESAKGLDEVMSIAQYGPPLVALGFGGADLATDLGCAFAWEPLLYARSRIVHAAALRHIAVLDVPYLQVDDPVGLAAEACRARALGFTGKFAIHPRQIAPIRQAFLPAEQEVTAAQAIVDAWERQSGGVCVVAGRMVDAPVLAAAQRLLARNLGAFRKGL